MPTADSRAQERFLKDPNLFIERVLKEFTLTSPLNRLEAFGGEPIWEAPMVGFADGDDPLFAEFKKVVAPQHLTPREVMARHFAETLKLPVPEMPSVSVISFILPMNRETVRSNAAETKGPSLRWNLTRWKGQDFINELSRHLVAVLEGLGCHAVAPELAPFYRIERTPTGFYANWSQRHAAYAAGLGTFSLNEAFITRKGIAHRIGSVVVDMRLEPSLRPYAHHLANCRFYARGKCGKCILRCPAGAITEKGHDKLKCWAMLSETQKPWLEGAHGPGYIGRYAGCGLCQTGVPCEHRIPRGQKEASGARDASVVRISSPRRDR
jgi:epoxyqueuosine reductase